MPQQTPDTPWFAVSMGLVGVIVGYMVATTDFFGPVSPQAGAPAPPPVPDAVPPPPSQAAAQPPAAVNPAKDHIRGNPQATVTLIEYSDFECPFCKRHHATVQKILDTYKDDVNLVFRQFPLTSIHPHAQKAAEAAECAADLGGNDAFWRYHDGLFAMESLSDEAFVALAKQVGLREASFKNCLESGKFAQDVADQENEGMAAGVRGTPGNFLIAHASKETQTIDGAAPFERFASVIDGMLRK